jgi:hypothetical protein
MIVSGSVSSEKMQIPPAAPMFPKRFFSDINRRPACCNSNRQLVHAKPTQKATERASTKGENLTGTWLLRRQISAIAASNATAANVRPDRFSQTNAKIRYMMETVGLGYQEL